LYFAKNPPQAAGGWALTTFHLTATKTYDGGIVQVEF
jgi:hypothetical protein